MSLSASQALITNAELRERVIAAIRATAAARIGWDGPAGTLARAAFARPDTLVELFMLRMATNQDVVKSACDRCGHTPNREGAATDDTISWIVGDAWEAIAQDLHPAPETEDAAASDA